MSGNAKVVPLKTAASALKATEQVQLARLPAPIHALQEKGKRLLLPLLHGLFDKADDALFEMADKAANNQEQNLYFESMRELRLKRRNMEATFSASLDRAFARLADASATATDNYGEVSLDNLSLVQNEELEELVAVDTMTTRANERYAESIQHLALRIDSLVPLKVYQKNSPLGPHTLCDAFSDAAKALDINIKARLVVYKLFDRLVMQELGVVYQALNQLLIEQNILPSLNNSGNHNNSGSLNKSGSEAKKSHQVPDAVPGAPLLGTTDEAVFQSLRELMGPTQPGEANASPMSGSYGASSGPVQLASEELLSLLSGIQRQRGEGPAGQLSLSQLVAEALSQQSAGAQVSAIDHDAINLVNMLFEFILDDHSLATPMKALLGRLQIPVVKVAIVDKTFFGKGGHPARRLLNEMAKAALGWQPDSKREGRDLLYGKLESIVQRLLNEFDSDVTIFDELLTDLLAFLEKEHRRAAILEQRTIDAEDGKAKAEFARLQVDGAIGGLIDGRELPAVVVKLLQDAWSNVLFLIHLKQGADSDAWRSALQTAEDLVWSVEADMTLESRPQLIKLVPDLLRRLRKGLEEVSYNPFDMTKLFKSLEAIHLGKLKAAPKASSTPAKSAAPPMREPLSATSPVASRRVADSAVAKNKASEARVEASSAVSSSAPSVGAGKESLAGVTTTHSEAKSSETTPSQIAAGGVSSEDQTYLQKVDKLTQGTWFELAEDEAHPFRCRLAAIIKPTGKYIFVNRSGVKVAEKTRDSLANALKVGGLRILDDGMLFDRALESVIGNLRRAREA